MTWKTALQVSAWLWVATILLAVFVDWEVALGVAVGGFYGMTIMICSRRAAENGQLRKDA